MTKTPKNDGNQWTPSDKGGLRQLARQNTPTRVMGIKLGRAEASVWSEAHQQEVSLKPTSQSTYNRQKK